MVLQLKMKLLVLLLIYYSRADARCSMMPYHEYTNVYPEIPNTDINDRYIELDEPDGNPGNTLSWKVKNGVKVVYFKAHELISGHVELECAVIPPGRSQCCLQNWHLSEIANTEQCAQRVFNKDFLQDEYRLVYETRNTIINWDQIIINIFVDTPKGLRRYFSGWPGKLENKVCSEIARSGHNSSRPQLARLISTNETNEIDYKMYADNVFRVHENETIRLQIQYFVRPTEELVAYMFSFNDATEEIKMTEVDQLRPIKLPLHVNQFTERIQLLTDYESHFHQTVFTIKVKAEHRALIIWTSANKAVEIATLKELLTAWIVKADTQAQFTWPEALSPGIRIVPLASADYTVARMGSTIRVKLSVEPKSLITCYKWSTQSGSYKVFNRMQWSSDSRSVILSQTTMKDSGLYRCTREREPVLDNHRVIILPQQIEIKVTAGNGKQITLRGGNEPTTTTNQLYLIVQGPVEVMCAVEVSTNYDHFNGITVTGFHSNHSETQTYDTWKTEVIEIGSDTRKTAVSIRSDPCESGAALMRHQIECHYEYTPIIGRTRKDIFQDAHNYSLHINFPFAYYPEPHPYIIPGTIQTNTESVSHVLRRFWIRSLNNHTLLEIPHAETDRAFQLTGEYTCVINVHGGHSITWTIEMDEDKKAVPHLCRDSEPEELSTEHEIDLSDSTQFAESRHNRLFHRNFSCKISANTLLFFISAVNLHAEQEKPNDLPVKFYPQLLSYLSDPDLLSVPLVPSDEHGPAVHHLVRLGLEWPDQSIKKPKHTINIYSKYIWSHLEVFENFIHRGDPRLSAVEFHKSGASTIANERSAEVHILVGSSALPKSRMLMADLSTVEECQFLNHRQVPFNALPAELKSSGQIPDYMYFNTSFHCDFRTNHKAWVFIMFPPEHNVQHRPIGLYASIKDALHFWIKHPQSEQRWTTFDVKGYQAAYRIQKIRLGWDGTFLAGQVWRAPLPGKLDSQIEVRLQCKLRSFENNQEWLIYDKCDKYELLQPKFYASLNESGHIQCSLHDCNQTGIVYKMSTVRRLLILPSIKYTKLSFQHNLLPDMTKPPPKGYNLAIRQNGYAYCAVTIYADWMKECSIQWRLMAVSDVGMTKTLQGVEISQQIVQGENNSFLASTYDVTQNSLERTYTSLQIDCWLSLGKQFIDPTDLKSVLVQRSSQTSIKVRIERSVIPKLFLEWISCDQVTMKHGLQAAVINPSNKAEFAGVISTEIRTYGKHRIAVLAFTKTDKGEVSMYLYKHQTDTTEQLQTPCTLIASEKITDASLLKTLSTYFESDQEQKLGTINNYTFECSIDASHKALAILAHTRKDTTQATVKALLKRVEELMGSTRSDASETIAIDHSVTTFSLTRLHEGPPNLPQGQVTADLPRLPPTLFEVEVIPVIDKFKKEVNCG